MTKEKIKTSIFVGSLQPKCQARTQSGSCWLPPRGLHWRQDLLIGKLETRNIFPGFDPYQLDQVRAIQIATCAQAAEVNLKGPRPGTFDAQVSTQDVRLWNLLILSVQGQILLLPSGPKLSNCARCPVLLQYIEPQRHLVTRNMGAHHELFATRHIFNGGPLTPHQSLWTFCILLQLVATLAARIAGAARRCMWPCAAART